MTHREMEASLRQELDELLAELQAAPTTDTRMEVHNILVGIATGLRIAGAPNELLELTTKVAGQAWTAP